MNFLGSFPGCIRHALAGAKMNRGKDIVLSWCRIPWVRFVILVVHQTSDLSQRTLYYPLHNCRGSVSALRTRPSRDIFSYRKLYYSLHNCRGSVSALRTRPSRDIFSYRTPTVMEGMC